MSPFATLVIMLAAGGVPDQASPTLIVPSVLLSPVEEADIAAKESGPITTLKPRRGQTVEANDILAQVDDAEAILASERAEIELDIAREQAANDVSIRHARKTLEVSRADLARALGAVEQYPQSISDREMARLRLTVERDTLAIEQSEYEHRILQAGLRVKENELKLAMLRADRRTIAAPFAGIVAEVVRSRGEWVEPGDTVVRLLRIDRLRAEGFVEARHANSGLVGRAVELSLRRADGTTGSYQGEVVFVSPEVDPVNGQVLVWAEIENSDLTLRPGLKAALTINGTPILTAK